MLGVAGFAFEVGDSFFSESAVDYDSFAGHTVKLEEEGAAAFVIGFADVDELDKEGFSGGDLDVDFFVALEAVEVGGSGEDGEAVVVLEALLEFCEDLRIHEVAVEIVVGRGASELFADHFFGFLEVARWGEFAGADGDGDSVAKDELLDVLGPAAIGLAEASGEHVDDTFWEV